MKHFPCNKAAAAEKHDECQTADNGRRHGRKQSHHLKETLARHIRVIHAVSENESENDSRRRGNKGREDRVAEYLDELLSVTARIQSADVGTRRIFTKG